MGHLPLDFQYDGNIDKMTFSCGLKFGPHDTRKWWKWGSFSYFLILKLYRVLLA